MTDDQLLALARSWNERADRLSVTAGILAGESRGKRSAEISTLRQCARQLTVLVEENKRG